MSAFDPSAPGLPIVGGGGASLPDTPAAVLLDAANAGKIVGLAQGTGEGTSFDPNVVVEAGVGLAAGQASVCVGQVGAGPGEHRIQHRGLGSIAPLLEEGLSNSQDGQAAKARRTTLRRRNHLRFGCHRLDTGPTQSESYPQPRSDAR